MHTTKHYAMTDDIVTRLRDIASLRGPMAGAIIPIACTEAADEIERLRKRNTVLFDTLRAVTTGKTVTSRT